MYFQYGEKEVAYLKSRDHDLAKGHRSSGTS